MADCSAAPGANNGRRAEGNLCGMLAKRGEARPLRDRPGFGVRRLMAVAVQSLSGAPHGPCPGDRLRPRHRCLARPGEPMRHVWNSAIPSRARAAASGVFSSHGGRPRRRRPWSPGRPHPAHLQPLGQSVGARHGQEQSRHHPARPAAGFASMRPKAVSERPDCVCCCHQRGSPQQLRRGARCRGAARPAVVKQVISGVHDGPVAAMTQMLGASCQRCRMLVVGILLAARPAGRRSAAFIAPRSHRRMPRPSRCARASVPVSCGASGELATMTDEAKRMRGRNRLPDGASAQLARDNPVRVPQRRVETSRSLAGRMPVLPMPVLPMPVLLMPVLLMPVLWACAGALSCAFRDRRGRQVRRLPRRPRPSCDLAASVGPRRETVDKAAPVPDLDTDRPRYHPASTFPGVVIGAKAPDEVVVRHSHGIEQTEAVSWHTSAPLLPATAPGPLHALSR
jgi:hypothetical protein